MSRKLLLVLVVTVVLSSLVVGPASAGLFRHGHRWQSPACSEALPSCCGPVKDAGPGGGAQPKVSDPVTAEEQKWFEELYGSLDAGRKKVMAESWQKDLSHAQRQQKYQDRKKMINDIQNRFAVEEKANADKAKIGGAQPKVPDPFTAEELKWFDEIWGSLDPDKKNVMKESWQKDLSHAQRQQQHEDFEKAIDDANQSDVAAEEKAKADKAKADKAKGGSEQPKLPDLPPAPAPAPRAPQVPDAPK